jgi:hypothetical protein
MTPPLPIIILVIGLIGVGGMLLMPWWGRVLLWLPSLGLLFLGIFALKQGGIAEPFSSRQMLAFCSITFWPAIGCAVGEVRRLWRRTHRLQERAVNEIS